MLKQYEKFLNILQKATLYVSTGILAFIILINIANILSSMFLAKRLNWVLEVSLILFVYSVLICIPALYRNNDLITMDIFNVEVDSSSNKTFLNRAKNYLSILVEILIFIFLVVLLYHAIKLSWGQRDILSRGLHISRAAVTFPVILSSFLMLLINIFNLITKFKCFLANR